MKDFKPKCELASGILDAVIRIGKMAEERMSDVETSEEYAFLLGHVNVAAAIAHGAHNNGITKVNLDYNKAKKAYQEANAEAEVEEEWHQISMEELFPAFLEALKSTAEKHKATKKATTTKKSTKKE